MGLVVLKSLVKGLFEFGTGLAGNLLAGYIQANRWEDLFTPTRLAATLAGAALGLLLMALLDGERGLAWNWRWHRFWYLRELVEHPQLRQWETTFARLKLAQGKRVSVTEVISEGERQDMVSMLYEKVVSDDHDERRAVVLGEPGAGKTTGLERLTWELARRGARRLGLGWRMPVLLRLGNYQDGKLVDFAADEMSSAATGQMR